MAPLSTKPAYMNGQINGVTPSVATLEQSEVTKLQKELLTVADEKSTLQQTVRSFTDRLRQAADDLTSAQRAHKLELSKVESTWEGIVKGLKQQINDLGADLARVKLGAAQDKAAAEQRSMTLVTKLGATEAKLAAAEQALAAEKAASAEARAAAQTDVARSEAISGALGRSVAARDAEIERLEGLGVRSLTKKLLGTAKDKTVAATKTAAAYTSDKAVKIYSYASDKAVQAGRATRAQIGAIREEPARLTRAPAAVSAFTVGSAPRIRVLSVIAIGSFFVIGVLRSARTSTTLPLTLSRMEASVALPAAEPDMCRTADGRRVVVDDGAEDAMRRARSIESPTS